MRKSKLLALLALALTVIQSASAQQLVTPTGANGTTGSTLTNALPIEVSGDGTNLTSASHPLATQLSQGNSAVASTNPLSVRLSNGAANIAASTPLPTQLSQGNAVISLANPLFSQLSADGTNAVNSTHGLYVNLLQSNAVVSASNPTAARISADGTNYASLTAPLAVRLSVDGTNGSAASHPLAVQLSQGNGVISATNGLYSNLLQGNVALSNINAIPTYTATNPLATYAYSSGYLTLVAAATDVLGVVGSGTKTVKIHKITISGTQTTAGNNKWFLIKRSTANTGSTPSAVTAVPLDSTNSAATATVQAYTTTNPTTGTPVGTIASPVVVAPAPATSTGQASFVLFDDKVTGQPIVLRGIAQELDINFAGAAIPTGLSPNFDIVTTEE
jgi:hypothetical protein